jgi:hypothetical protein
MEPLTVDRRVPAGWDEPVEFCSGLFRTGAMGMGVLTTTYKVFHLFF